MTALVLLCEDRVPPFEPGGWLPGADVHVISELCSRPRVIGRLARGASSLIVGVCPGEYSLGAVQTQAREAGLDSLGVEIVDLRSARDDPDRLALILAGAVARAEAFAGSRPENAKLSFPRTRSRRSLFTLRHHEYLAAPSVDTDRCAASLGCSACADVCPRKALTWSDGCMRLDTAACEPCGLCVPICPPGAMVNPAATPVQIEAQMARLLDPTLGPGGPRGIVYTCQRGSRPEDSAGWYPVGVPCTGMVGVQWLLAPLLMGATATAVRPCGEAGCPSDLDDEVAVHVEFCRQLLDRAGVSAEHVTTRPGVLPAEGWATESHGAGELAHPFLSGVGAVLNALGQVVAAPAGLVLEHEASPVGVIEIRGDACTGCTVCAQACPTGALAWERDSEHVVVSFDAALCTACRQCVQRCPEDARDAIGCARVTDLAALQRGRTVLFRDENVRCASCGMPIATGKMMDRMRELLGSDSAAVLDVVSRYCLDCRRGPLPLGSGGATSRT